MRNYEVWIAAGRLEAKKEFRAMDFAEACKVAEEDRKEIAKSLALSEKPRITKLKEKGA